MVCIYLQRTVADIRTLKELLATFHSSHCQHHTSVCLSWEGLQKCFHHLWHVCGFSVLHICRDVLKPLIFMWPGLPVRLGETLGKDRVSLTNMFNFFFFLLLNFVFTPPLPYSSVFTLSKMDGLEQFQHFTSISLENKIAIICRCWKRLCVCVWRE